MIYIKCLVIIASVVWGTAWGGYANAQQVYSESFSVNEGLPSGQVYDAVEDDSGWYWLATAYGLVKTDGKEVIVYDAKNGLKDSYIYDVFIDSRERLWVSTDEGGVAVYEAESDSLIYSYQAQIMDSVVVNSMAEDVSGTMWFATFDHGLLYDSAHGLDSFTTEDGLPGNTVWDLHVDSKGSLWVSTQSGLAVVRGDTVHRVYDEESGMSGSAAYRTFEDAEQRIWVSTNNGVTIIEGDSLRSLTELNGKELSYVYAVSQDREGRMWIGTESRGLFILDGELSEQIQKEQGLGSNYIYHILRNRFDEMLVLSDGGGISIYRNLNFRFYNEYTPAETHNVYSVLSEEDVIWYGSEDGLVRFDTESGKFNRMALPADVTANAEIWDIERLPSGNLLLINIDYRLIEYNGAGFRYSGIQDLLPDNYITDAEVSRDGLVWLALDNGLAVYDPESGSIEKYAPGIGYWDNYFVMIFEDSEGRVWAGSEDGLFMKAPGAPFISIVGSGGQSIYELREDRHGNILAGTSLGVMVIKYTDGELRLRKLPLPEEESSETMSLMEDQEGYLWRGTNAGLFRYNYSGWLNGEPLNSAYFSLTEYGKGREFNGNAVTAGNNGDLWFGTMGGGLMQLKTPFKNFDAFRKAPETFIRSVNVSGKESDLSGNVQQLQFSNYENNIRVNYAALKLSEQNRVEYSYMLEGHINEWQDTGNATEVNFINLQPGDYTFRVKARIPGSGWTTDEQAAGLAFTIALPFWQRAWFLLLMLLILTAIVVAIINYRVHMLEKSRLKELVDEQTRDLSDALSEKEVLLKEIHHRVKNNMAVISGLLELQSWNMEDGEVKNAIEDTKLRIQTMSAVHEKLYQNENLEFLDFKEFADGLVRNISGSIKADGKNIHVQIDIEDCRLDINKAIPCGLILNETLANAFEHAFDAKQEGNIYVRFSHIQNEYEMEIADNGKGMSEDILERERSSLGLTLIESLSMQLRAEHSIHNEQGTRWLFRFPAD